MYCFFGNNKISTKLITVESVIKSISQTEKLFKTNLRIKIAQEEYGKCEAIPGGFTQKKLLPPPPCYKSLHECVKDKKKPVKRYMHF